MTVYVFFLSNLWILILFICHLTYLFIGQKWLKKLLSVIRSYWYIVKGAAIPTWMRQWKKNREKKTNFIVYLNDNEVKWYSDDTVT